VCFNFVIEPKVLRLTREANNNPVRGGVPRHFLALAGWHERGYGFWAA
jgi:hypothetical protein